MLTGEHLSYRYGPGSAWILQDVSISLAAGEIVGVRGHSGRGKTTLGKLLAGYLTPTAGNVTCDGHPLPQQGYCPVQLIFQHPELAINPRWRIGRVVREGYDPPKQMLEALSIDAGWFERWPHELSGGELQRVAVARALGPSTRYLIADEITAMLDANTQAQIWQVVLAHARHHHLGVLVFSHTAPLLERLCDRSVEL